MTIGFLVVIPLVMSLPLLIMEWLGIENINFRLMLCFVPFMIILRCLEAMFGFVPHHYTTSLGRYLQLAGFTALPKLDEKTSVPLTPTLSDAVHIFVEFHKDVVLYYMTAALVSPYDYEPFHYTQPPTDIFVAIHWNDLMNNFISTWLFYLTLSLGFRGTSIMAMVIGGFVPDDMMDHPITASQSPSDFWGRRWNRLVHDGLKQGVYKPVRFYTSSSTLATLAAFLMSGILHEYLWQVLFYDVDISDPHRNEIMSVPVKAQLGKLLLFFGWNGVLVGLENLIGRERWDSFGRLLRYRPILSVLTLMLSLPVGHLFTGDMLRGGWFHSIERLQGKFVLELKR